MAFRIDDQTNEARVLAMEYVVSAAFGGKKAALGRRLGYKDGSFVGQMLRRERPITEGTFRNMLVLHEVRSLDLTKLIKITERHVGVSEPGTTYRIPATSTDRDGDLAQAVSQRQHIVTPTTIVWEDLKLESIEGQFLMAVKGDALMPTYPPGQMAIWQAGDADAANPGQAVLVHVPDRGFELRFLERRGTTWAGVSQRAGFGELQPERDQAKVVARLRYLDLG